MCGGSSHKTTNDTNHKLGRCGWTPVDPKQNTTTNSADKHPERLLTRKNCKQTSTNYLNVSVREHYSLSTRWGWSQRLTQHICGHTSFQTDYKHLGDNFWRFQRRGSPIPQQTWPSELTCSSQINLKQRVTSGAPLIRGAVTHLVTLGGATSLRSEHPELHGS